MWGRDNQKGGKLMNKLIKIVNHDGHPVVTSRQIAEDFEKEHNDTKKRIRELAKDMGEISRNYFILSEYKDTMNRTQEEYLITRDGFSLLVMGFTGTKALEWKLKYIEAFNKMESHIKEQQAPKCLEDVMIQSLLEMKAVKQQLNEVNHRVLQVNEKTEAVQNDLQSMRDVYTLSPNGWRSDTSKLINAIANRLGGFDHIRHVREESYKMLDERAGARLGIRLTNMKKNVLVETGSKSKSDKITKLDVIAADKKLIEVYCLIVKEMAIKYKAA
jgi:Rha family phage regulatory protein